LTILLSILLFILTMYLISIIYITDMLPQHPISTMKLISD